MYRKTLLFGGLSLIQTSSLPHCCRGAGRGCWCEEAKQLVLSLCLPCACSLVIPPHQPPLHVLPLFPPPTYPCSALAGSIPVVVWDTEHSSSLAPIAVPSYSVPR